MTRASSILVPLSLLAAGAAQAGQQEGVLCPGLAEAMISNANRTLVCAFSGTTTKKSICTPLAFGAKGVTVGAVTLDPVGRDGGIDQCVNPVTNQRVDSIMEPMAPYQGPPTNVKRIVSPTGQDQFEVQYKRYDFPETAEAVPLTVLGDPATGVTCPSGYDGDRRTNSYGRVAGIRCDKYDGAPRAADCDFGWTVARDSKGDEDRCIGPLGLGEGPTKPEGMTKIQHDAERALPTVGWVLTKKSGVDTWQRKVYAYPNKN